MKKESENLRLSKKYLKIGISQRVYNTYFRSWVIKQLFGIFTF